jgi:glyoxylase-like metal-dependent hydrolase (beta-lactamase superfamily II)
MTAYLDSLEKIRARGFSVLWPTHGPPIREVAPFLAAYRAHRLTREAQVLKLLGEGPSRIQPMVERLYANVDRRLHPAAAHSLWAHLIKLVRDGRVLTEGAPELQSEYRLA